jgi:FemAB-related protein (PEP-CTERM system-associated)
VRVAALTPALELEWDRFVVACPQGSFFHLSGWGRVVAGALGFRQKSVCALRGDQIVGVLPLFLVSNWIVGKCLISVPLGVYGGICTEDDEAESLLLEKAKDLAKTLRVDYLELRHRSRGVHGGFHRNPLYSTFTTILHSDPEVNLKRLPRDTRYMIRKAVKAGLEGRHGVEQFDAFYDLFAQSMHRLGTPVFGKRWFMALLHEFSAFTDLYMVYSGKEPVTGVLSFRFRDILLPFYAGASDAAPRLAANNFMYWELMKWAAENGFRTFDFGRSKQGTGAYAFKSQWNMEVQPLDYEIFLERRKDIPNFSPLNPKFALAGRIWQKLPHQATLLLGPRIVRCFP